MKFKLNDNIQLLSWFNILFYFRFYYVVAILYFSEVTHSHALGLSIFSIAQIAQALFELPTGIYSDRIGRRKSLILGTVISILSVIFYAIGHWYWMLVVGAILEGLYRSLFSGNNDALLYESLVEIGQKYTYHSVLGKMRSDLELAGFIAAIIGGFLVSQSFQLLLLASVVPQLISLWIAFKIIEPKSTKEDVGNIYSHLNEAIQTYKKSSKLRNISLADIIGSGVGESSWSFQSVFYRSVLPMWAVGFVMSLNFLMSAISFRLSGWIIGKFKARNVLIYQEVYSRILCTIAFLFPTGMSPFMIAAASFVYGPSEVAKNTLLQEEFTDKQRATMASFNSLIRSCFFALFAVLIGLIADKLGSAKALLFAQVSLFPVLFFYLRVFKKHG